MNTLVIVLIAAVCLILAYALYGRWIAKTWGIDPTAAGSALGSDRRHLLRRSHRFRRSLCFGQERRQVDGSADRKIHR